MIVSGATEKAHYPMLYMCNIPHVFLMWCVWGHPSVIAHQIQA